MFDRLDTFREYFKGFEKNYIVIGGTACELLLQDVGFDFRVTKDLDMVLFVEGLSKEFGFKFWEYVRAGGYKIQEKSSGEPVFYRFKNPSVNNFPAMIELFSKRPDYITASDDVRLTPIHIDDEVSSLSAILLDDEYYELLKEGMVNFAGISILDTRHIILFKIKAWKDLQEKNAEKNKIAKHRNDVFRLAQLLSVGTPLEISSTIYSEVSNFVTAMSDFDINLRGIGVIDFDKETILKLILKNYVVK